MDFPDISAALNFDVDANKSIPIDGKIMNLDWILHGYSLEATRNRLVDLATAILITAMVKQ